MMVLGVGDWGVSGQDGEVIKTLALGSCVAVIIADSVKQIAGMVHVALPDSSLGADKVADLPGYFADTGLEILFQGLSKLGCIPSQSKFIVKLVGGASILDPNNTFNIGKRNILSVKRLLWARGLGPVAEDVGGTISRTVSIEVGSMQVKVTSPSREALNL